jgi:hypothetical protein
MSTRFDAVYMHIGHGKTGSSFLQSTLALSQEALEQHGFTYPLRDEVAQKARKGFITGGNLRAQPGGLTALAEALPEEAAGKLLISAESLFRYLERNGEAFLEEYQQLFPGVPLHILCYVRDPVDHAISAYHQKVKRSGYTKTLEDSLGQYLLPSRTIAVLSVLKAGGADITVLNYSRHSKDLLGSLAGWLGMPGEVLTTPDVRRVNRSLTNAELELQRRMNDRLGSRASRFVSDPLCNQLPDIRSETPPLSREALEAFLTRIADEIATPEYQALVPEAERPQTGTVDDHIGRFPAEPDQLVFTPGQVQVFVDAIARVLAVRDNDTGEEDDTPRRGRKGRGGGRKQRAAGIQEEDTGGAGRRKRPGKARGGKGQGNRGKGRRRKAAEQE